MKLVDLKITLSFPSFFHVCGHVSKFFFFPQKKKKTFLHACCLCLQLFVLRVQQLTKFIMSLKEKKTFLHACCLCLQLFVLRVQQLTKFIMSLTYFMLKINIEFEKNIDVQEFQLNFYNKHKCIDLCNSFIIPWD